MITAKLMTSFKDRYAKHGRPFKAPEYECNVKAQPLSRSLIELSKFDAESKFIKVEVKGTKLRLNLQHVIGDRVVINKKDAIQFAQFILESYAKTTNKRV